MVVVATLKNGSKVNVDVAARDIVGRSASYTLKAVSKVTKAVFGQETVAFAQVGS